MNVIRKTVPLPDGREIIIETGKLAKQADGAVMVTLGKTMLLATVCSAQEANPGTDFMPLSVDYKEKFSACGRFPGGFLRREGRPSDYEILISRLVDRALRPLFPDDYHAETFVNVTLYSADGVDAPDALAGLAASAALAVSDIPFGGPISEVRVARIDGKFVINPTMEQLQNADLELIVAATLDNIMMVEGEMKEVSEDVLLNAIKAAHEAIKPQCQVQLDMMEAAGKTEKRLYCHEDNDEDLRRDVREKTYQKAYDIAVSGNADKHCRTAAFEAIVEEYIAAIPEEEATDERKALIKRYYHDVEKDAMRRAILDEGKRLDGRKTNEIRPIWSEVDYLPATHGSAIFTRGETQSLSTVTLGTKLDEKIIDEALITGTDRFLLHYNFPPYSTGEVGRMGAPKRREIGHGRLAKRALIAVLPEPEDFSYTMRVVSEITESNGSSSMASVCGGCLSLLSAGVPLKAHVAGIAMGLILENNKFAVLTDILGDEDHLGDMDFKVAGTTEGVTALQMDIKIQGITKEIMQIALEQAKEARLHILAQMKEAVDGPQELSQHAPRLYTMKINPDKIREVIGKGGETIRAITAETATEINIEDDGTVTIAATTSEAGEAARKRIEEITAEVEVGKVYEGTVVKILDNNVGAIVTVMPGKDGLVHVSEIVHERVKNVGDYLQVGQTVKVKALAVDDRGRVRLSMKALLDKPAAE